MIDGNSTIGEAKEFLKENWQKGIDCPVCGQRVQLYDYKMFSSNAVALIVLYKLQKENPKDTYFHARQFAYGNKGVGRAMHYADMRFWGFIMPRPLNDDPRKSSSGYWCITEKGKLFVENKVSVQSRILIFNNKFRGYSEKSVPITIKDALENHFDYRELIGEHYSNEPVQERLV